MDDEKPVQRMRPPSQIKQQSQQPTQQRMRPPTRVEPEKPVQKTMRPPTPLPVEQQAPQKRMRPPILAPQQKPVERRMRPPATTTPVPQRTGQQSMRPPRSSYEPLITPPIPRNLYIPPIPIEVPFVEHVPTPALVEVKERTAMEGDIVKKLNEEVKRQIEEERRQEQRDIKDISNDDGVVIGEDIKSGDPITVTQEGLYSGTYIVGVQGSGKTSILTQIGLKQIEAGECVIALDPTTGGDMIRDLVSRMPEDRVKDTFIFALPEFKFPFGLPVFSYMDTNNVGYEAREEAKNHITTAFEKLWPESKTQVYIKKMLRYLIPILLDHPKFTLAHVPRFFADDKFRARVLTGITDEEIRSFWVKFKDWPKDQKYNETTPFLNRVDELLADGFVKYLICQKPRPKGEDPQYKKRLVNLQQLIMHKKIILIHLPLDQRAYKQASRTIGIFFMMLIYGTTFNFGKLPSEKRPTYTVLVDEFAKWAIGSADEFRDLLSYGRKYGVQLVLANQYLDQFKEEGMESLKPAVTTASTVISLRTNRDDAQYLAPIFEGFPYYDESVVVAEPEEFEEEEYQEPDEPFTKEATNYYLDVCSKLDQHPERIVKQIYRQFIRPLQEATKMKRDGDKLPTQDFGFGKVEFYPNYAIQALDRLNEFYYDAEVNKKPNQKKLFAFFEVYTKASGITMLYEEALKVRRARHDAKNKADFESWKKSYSETLTSYQAQGAIKQAEEKFFEREAEIYNAYNTAVAEMLKCTDALVSEYWRTNLLSETPAEARKVEQFGAAIIVAMQELLKHPLTIDRSDVEREKREWEHEKQRKREEWERDQRRKREQWERDEKYRIEHLENPNKEMTPQDVAKELTRLENREGFARVASEIYRMRTVSLPDPVGWEEIAQRQNDILARTKFTYCRGKEEVKREIETAFDEPPGSLPTIPPTQPQSPSNDTLDKYENLTDF